MNRKRSRLFCCGNEASETIDRWNRSYKICPGTIFHTIHVLPYYVILEYGIIYYIDKFIAQDV